MRRVAATMPAAGSDFLTLMLGAAVLLCAVTLGVLVGRHFGFTKAAHSTPTTVSANNTPAENSAENAAGASSLSVTASNVDAQHGDDTSLTTAPLKRTDSTPAPGGLKIYENGKEIYHLQPGQPQPRQAKPHQPQTAPTSPAPSQTVATHTVQSQTVQPRKARPSVQSSAVQSRTLQPAPIQPEPRRISLPVPVATAAQQNISAASVANNDPQAQAASSVPPERVVELSPAEAEDSLLSRVEPEYPDQARQDNVQGDVLLEVRIGTDGTVEGVQLLSGPQPLAQASSDAVRQWRFKPHMLNGQAVKMQTRVTLSFRLPG